MYHSDYHASPIGLTPLKFSTSLTFAVVAIITMAGFAYNGLIRQRPVPVPKATAVACTPEAIRQVADALERSVLSAQCAKQLKSASPSGEVGPPK